MHTKKSLLLRVEKGEEVYEVNRALGQDQYPETFRQGNTGISEMAKVRYFFIYLWSFMTEVQLISL